jgi:hypothetical protein
MLLEVGSNLLPASLARQTSASCRVCRGEGGTARSKHRGTAIQKKDISWNFLIKGSDLLLFGHRLELILFPFPLTPAQKLVIDLSFSAGVANMTLPLITHH